MKISLKNYWLLSTLLVLPLSNICGQAGNNNPTGPAGEFNGSVTTGCSYDPYTGNAKRTVTDLTVAGAVGKYGLSYSRTWNSRQGSWRSSYYWAIGPVVKTQQQPMYYNVFFPDGRFVTFTGPGYTAPGPAGVRERLKPNGSLVYLLLPDGGKVEFTVNLTIWPGEEGVPTWYFYEFKLNAIIDPYGQRTTITTNADGSFQMTEPAGRWIKIFPVVGGTQIVRASDGREVHYTYTTGPVAPGTTSYTLLTSVAYYGDPSLTATYTYEVPNVGSASGSPVLKTCDDPMYAGPMKKISYTYATVNEGGWPAVYGQILSENSGTTGQAVSTLAVNDTLHTRTETRGDGKTRTFTYTSTGGFLTGATDFKGVAQTQTYDAKKFVNAVTNRNGNTTNFTNNTLTGGVTQIQHPLTPGDTPPGTPRGTVNYTYGWASCPDPNNRDVNNPYYLYSVTDEGGNVTRFTRDTSKRVTRVDYPDGGYETFTYNSFGQVLSHRMKTGGMETSTYDARGLKQTYRDPYHASGNPNAWYQYDLLDRVSGVTDTLGNASGDVNHTTNYTYNNRGQVTVTTLPTDPVDSQRHTVVNTYNPDGTLATVTNQLGHAINYTFDEYRRPRTVTTPQRFAGDVIPRTTSIYYDATGTGDDYTHTDANVTWLKLPSGNVVQNHYDENYRKDYAIASAADGTTDVAKSSYVYDNVGNVTSVLAPDEQSGQPNFGKSTVTVYDQRNRPMSVTDPLGKVTTFTYDAAGRKKSATRPNTQVITYDSYDSMNRLLQQTVKQTPDPDAVTKYTYSTSGLLQTMKDPRLVALNSTYSYSYIYDQMGRKTSLTYPAAVSGTGSSETFEYDTAGRLWKFTNRAGSLQTFSYDALHRKTGFTWTGTPDPATPSVTYGYDVASRMTSIVNGNATITRTYFNDNLLNTETQTPAGQPSRTITYTYNADGGRANVQYPDGYSFAYAYTGRNQLNTIASTSPASTVATYGYDVNGNLTSRALDNLTSSSYVYDALNRATNISHVLNDGTRTQDYGYEPLTNNRKWTKRDGGDGDVFGYDLNNQVTATQLNIANPDTTSVGSQTITYDANGNRESFAAYGPNDTYAKNNLNQYSSRNLIPASYDNKGNLITSVDASTYTYDAQNRLVSATKAGNAFTFKYDGLNRQVSRTLNEQAGGTPIYSVWDGWELIEEIQNGGVIAAYLTGAGGLVKNLVSGNYYYQDGSGSTSHLADSTGDLLEWYRYDLHGTPVVYDPSNNVRTAGTTNGVRHLFTGQQWYSELGLYDLRNRFYSPDLGRFLQPDPIGFAGDPGNIYRYCGNNPINRSDPSGLEELHVQQPPQSKNGYDPAHIFVYGAALTGAESAYYSKGWQPIASMGELNYLNYNGQPEFTISPLYVRFGIQPYSVPTSLSPSTNSPPSSTPGIAENPFASPQPMDIGFFANAPTIPGLPSAAQLLGPPPPTTISLSLNLTAVAVDQALALSGGYYANRDGIGKFTSHATSGIGGDIGPALMLGANNGPMSGKSLNFNGSVSGVAASLSFSQGSYFPSGLSVGITTKPIAGSVTITESQPHNIFWPIFGD